MIQLTVRYDMLCTPHSAIVDRLMRDYFTDDPGLLYEYPSGDHDIVGWPKYDPEQLHSALYDAIEMGKIPSNTTEVQLPDGKVFQIQHP